MRNIFTRTNFSYDKSASPRCRYSAHRNNSIGRIEYVLPFGQRMFFYKIPNEIKASSKKEQKSFLREFEKHLRAGYFPYNAVNKIEKAQSLGGKQNDKVTLREAVEFYYTTYNRGKWNKLPKSIKSEKPTLLKQVAYFESLEGVKYIQDLQTKHLGQYNREIEGFKSRNSGETIKKSTQKSYKKLLKAFLNCLAKPFDLKLDLSELDLQIYNMGKPDNSLYCRTTVIPHNLLDHVDLCSYKTPVGYPDRKEMVHLLRTTGICKDELSCLSEENLFYGDKDTIYHTIDSFNCLKIFDKPSCPSKHETGFTVKSKNRIRPVLLDDRSIQFIKKQLEVHKNNNIFGKEVRTDKYIKYRFLFPIFRNNMWVRCDSFLRGIQSLLTATNEEFGLGCSEKYTIHDFRNTRNAEMVKMGLKADIRSEQLGHSEKVNESNYLSLPRQQEERRKRSYQALYPILNEKNEKEDNLYYLNEHRGVQ